MTPTSTDATIFLSNDIIHPSSIDTMISSSVDTVHRDTVHHGTVHPTTDTTCVEAEKVDELILKIDKKGIWRDKGGRPCNIKGQLINAEEAIIPDVIACPEIDTFDLSSQWYDWGSEDPFQGLPYEDPRDLIKRLEEVASATEHKVISADHILCKIFPYSLSGDAFTWFSQLQPRSLTSWEDIKTAFLNKFLYQGAAERQKKLDEMNKASEEEFRARFGHERRIVYIEPKKESETISTHINKSDIQVQLADEDTQRGELNRKYLVNHSLFEEDEQDKSGELSRVEEADIKDPSSTSIDTSTLASIDSTTAASIINTTSSIDTSTSESIDKDFCNRSIPLEIPESSSCPQDTADSTLKSTDVSSSFPSLDVHIENGENLGDLDSSKEVTEDFLELEEWLEDIDHNLEQKLDDKRTAKRKDGETSSKASIDRHQPDEIDRYPPCIIDRHPPDCIDRQPWLDELPGYIVELEPVEEIVHNSEASHITVPKHQRPPIWTEEANGFHKRVKRMHDPMKILVPGAVFEAESPIPPDKCAYLSSYTEILDDHHHVEASQRGLRFRDEVDKTSAEEASIDTDQTPSIDMITPPSIDTTTDTSIDTRRESEQNEYEVCGNIFDGDTATRSNKSGGKKKRNWKKRKRTNRGSQLSLIPHFSDNVRKSIVRLHKSTGKKRRNWKKRKRTKEGSQIPYFLDCVRKSRVRSRCFSQPFEKLKALLVAEMIDKGEESMDEAFTQE